MLISLQTFDPLSGINYSLETTRLVLYINRFVPVTACWLFCLLSSFSTVIGKYRDLYHSYPMTRSQPQTSDPPPATPPAPSHPPLNPRYVIHAQKCIDDAKTWMTVSNLNDDKCEAMPVFSGRECMPLSSSFPDSSKHR